MNTAVSHYVWEPLKTAGRKFAFLDRSVFQVIFLVLFLGLVELTASTNVSATIKLAASTAAAAVSIMFYIRAFTTKGAAVVCWNLIMLGHVFSIMFLALAADGNWKYLAMYGAGVVLAFVMGHLCLWYLAMKSHASTLQDYQGAIYVFAKLGNFFFIVCLLFMAFPISPSFLAQDILLGLIPGSHVLQTVLFCFSYLLVGVSTMRLYTKIFFGPHKTSYHERAYKSS